jgi:hypothetical protein
MFRFERQTHGFFDDLVAVFASYAALGQALQASRFDVAEPYEAADYIWIQGSPRVSNLEFRFFPADLLQILANDGWPSVLEVHHVPIADHSPTRPVTLTGLRGIYGQVIQSAFVHYFESFRPKLETRYGQSPQAWPAAWNFARVLRNAFSHGGRIHFLNSNAASVQWRTLNYGPADNGQMILFRDITPVEVVLLMDEIDSLL